MTKHASLLFLVALFSIIAIFVTLYLPKTILNINDLNNISCGWPIQFIEFSNHANPPLPLKQACISWMSSPMDTPKTFLWESFFINITIVYSVMWGGLYLAQKFNR